MALTSGCRLGPYEIVAGLFHRSKRPAGQRGRPAHLGQQRDTPGCRVAARVRGGGNGPRWRSDGREIIYTAPDGRVMAVAVAAPRGVIQFGKPIALFPLQADPGGWGTGFTANADHTRFVLGEALKAERQTIRVLTNWEARLRTR